MIAVVLTLKTKHGERQWYLGRDPRKKIVKAAHEYVARKQEAEARGEGYTRFIERVRTNIEANG